jgi:hypothetical protein
MNYQYAVNIRSAKDPGGSSSRPELSHRARRLRGRDRPSIDARDGNAVSNGHWDHPLGGGQLAPVTDRARVRVSDG